MSWKCPECGEETSEQKCRCGYAYFRVLGVKPDSSKDEVRKTYQYLINVWQETARSHDATSRKRAEDRLAKINAAIEIYKSIASPSSKTGAGISVRKFAAPAVLIAVILLVGGYFLFRTGTRTETAVSQTQSPPERQQEAPAPAASSQAPAVQPSQPSQPRTIETLPPPPPVAGSDAAIELVKKSKVLDRMFTVDALMKKWTDDNAGKLQFLGWKTKKIDEQTYVVSYIASDGMSSSGFYFDVDFSTGTVRDLAKYPELKSKYGLQ